MKLWVFSDLHLSNRGEKLRIPQADVAIVAGDVGEGLPETIRWLAEGVAKHMPVVLVAGNHEFYGSSVADQFELARRLIDEGGGDNVHLLENQAVVLGGVRFLGATLWTDYALYGMNKEPYPRDVEVGNAMMVAERLIADHYVIRNWPASAARKRHLESRAWLEDEMQKAHAGPTVVVTHHAPHPRSTTRGYEESTLNPAFLSDLTEVIASSRPNLWVHGHVHSSHDYRIDQTRIVCNPRGYGSGNQFENRGFDPSWVIDVDGGTV